jgi:hypothetical protein
MILVDTMSSPRPPRPPAGGSLEQVASAAYTMMGLVFAGLFGGLALDHARGTAPRWTLVLSLAGVALGVVSGLVMVFARRGAGGVRRDDGHDDGDGGHAP